MHTSGSRNVHHSNTSYINNSSKGGNPHHNHQHGNQNLSLTIGSNNNYVKVAPQSSYSTQVLMNSQGHGVNSPSVFVDGGGGNSNAIAQLSRFGPMVL
jgi:hypothetical protein